MFDSYSFVDSDWDAERGLRPRDGSSQDVDCVKCDNVKNEKHFSSVFDSISNHVCVAHGHWFSGTYIRIASIGLPNESIWSSSCLPQSLADYAIAIIAYSIASGVSGSVAVLTHLAIFQQHTFLLESVVSTCSMLVTVLQKTHGVRLAATFSGCMALSNILFLTEQFSQLINISMKSFYHFILLWFSCLKFACGEWTSVRV